MVRRRLCQGWAISSAAQVTISSVVGGSHRFLRADRSFEQAAGGPLVDDEAPRATQPPNGQRPVAVSTTPNIVAPAYLGPQGAQSTDAAATDGEGICRVVNLLLNSKDLIWRVAERSLRARSLQSLHVGLQCPRVLHKLDRARATTFTDALAVGTEQGASRK